MHDIILQGRFRHKARSLAVMTWCTIQVLWRRAWGRPLVPGWSWVFEAGNLFVRAQFNHAFSLPDMDEARAYFDSMVSVLDKGTQVEIRPSEPGQPPGHWFVPRFRKSPMTLLYLHGGGYAFYVQATFRFITLLADWLGVVIFAPDYRLTPEHPHPAQLEDGLAAYDFLLGQGIRPQDLVVGGDSAGGHLMLMLLAHLPQSGRPQPALGIGLSPWTDVGRRGNSQFAHDPYDMVQGYMTLRFADWLRGMGRYGDAELSPVHQTYQATAPIYLQAGGHEILVDMIRDFAAIVQQQGGRVRLDVWPLMTHEFQSYGAELPDSRHALDLIAAAVRWAGGTAQEHDFQAGPQTERDCLT